MLLLLTIILHDVIVWFIWENDADINENYAVYLFILFVYFVIFLIFY